MAVVEGDFHAMLEVVHEKLVVLHHVAGFDVEQFAFCLIDGRLGKRRVEVFQFLAQAFEIERAVIVLILEAVLDVVAVEVVVFQPLGEQLDERLLVMVFVVV